MKNQDQQNSQGKKICRRDFMASTAGIAAFTIVPRYVLGGPGQVPPSEKINVASIGAGGMARLNILHCAEHANIVALCDVDEERAEDIYTKYPDVPKYRDFREMLAKQKDEIDAVIIATPDHTHAVATMAAMKAGKHVYTQKPLTHSLHEARVLTEAAKTYKVTTQMGNQGRSGEGTCLLSEWISDGAIGAVREVICWTNRPCHYWPQGKMTRPKESMPIPSTLDWDLWLGPAPYRDYHSCYVPENWRGWWDFGTGALGDMGCHIMDQPFDALHLGYPTSVEASFTAIADGEELDSLQKETGPIASIIRYEFPSRGGMPPVTLTWYDGGLRPFRPEELEEERRLSPSGMLFIGDEGKIMAGCYGNSPRLIPEAKMKAYQRPPKRLPRVEGDVEGHERDWLRACKDGVPARSNFEYAGPLTEVVLLGNLAIRCGGKKLLWDGPNMQVTNYPEANQYIRREYREGWSL